MRYRCMGRLFPRFEERGKFAKHGGLRGREVVSFGNVLTDVVELPSTIFVIFNQLPIASPNYGNRTSTEIGGFRLAGFFRRTLQISRKMPKERTPGIGNRIEEEDSHRRGANPCMGYRPRRATSGRDQVVAREYA